MESTLNKKGREKNANLYPKSVISIYQRHYIEKLTHVYYAKIKVFLVCVPFLLKVLLTNFQKQVFFVVVASNKPKFVYF